MSAGSTEPSTPRPRPRPGPSPVGTAHSPTSVDTPQVEIIEAPRRRKGRRPTGRGLVVAEPQAAQVVQAAGSAIVTAARVGRLLGRSGWRAAKQLPGVAQIEQQGRELRNTAAAGLLRLLDAAPNPTGQNPDEQRALMLAHQAGSDTAPLRTAMTELLERSTAASGAQSRDYLFGTIISQLVPDEARILAAFASGRTFASVDVVTKGRSGLRTVLANVSTIGAEARVSLPANVPTYLTRLDGYGLLEFGRATEELDHQYRGLEADKQVREAHESVERGRMGTARTVRRTVALSQLGQELWAACAPRDGRRA